MGWQQTPYIVPLLAATAISTATAIFAWRRRPTPGAAPLALLMLAVAEWSLVYALRLVSIDLASKILWSKMRYMGILAVPTTWLVFALQYTGHEKLLTRRNVALLAIEPLVIAVLVWSNEIHHLIWTEIELEVSGSIVVWHASHGAAFWIHSAYSYCAVFAGSALLIRALIRSPRLYRSQSGTLLFGALLPLVGNILSTFRLVPFPLDLTPFAFTIAGLAVSWGIYRFRLLDIVPVARRAVVEDMTDGVIVLDSQNRIVDLNPAAEKIIARRASDIIGQPTDKALAPNWAEQYRDVMQAQAEIAVGRDGEQCYDLRISPLQDRFGRPTGRLIVLRDITERKKMEREQERLIQELDAFAHTVAHDLKTPLTVTAGFAQVAARRREQLTAKQLDNYLQAIEQHSQKMTNIVDELLLLSRIQRQEEIAIAPLDMPAVLKEAWQRLAYLAEERGATISQPDAWPVALGYGPWIEEVWVNYISNAIQYGGDPPHVELGATVEPDRQVRFWVRDNGAGLSPEEQEQLFIPFTQLGQAQTKGHGLGLSIVQRIVERLGGQVGVESQVGQGSVFSFTLPGKS
ncbi:MAG: PAS domain-containing protein [Anaerolineae bacterium]|nr:PAS domain-containing protein [Anaerolineae bacterium]